MKTKVKKSPKIFRWTLDQWSAALLNNVSESCIPTTINFVPRKTAENFSAVMLIGYKGFEISTVVGLNPEDKTLRNAPPRRIDFFGENELLGSGFYFEQNGSLVFVEKNEHDSPGKSLFDRCKRCEIHFPMSGLKKNATVIFEAHSKGTFDAGNTLLLHDGMEVTRLASSLHCDADLVVFKGSAYR